VTRFQSGAVVSCDNFLPSSHDDLASIGHGVAGIHGEIEERHLQLVSVRLDRLKSEREPGLYPERCANGSLKEICHPVHEYGNVEHFLLEFLASREGKHALG
jgi:hypothetical protein